MSTEQLSESQNEKADWSRYIPSRALIRRSLMAAFGLLSARTTRHARAGAEVA
jgi:hypothetical protein